MNLVFILPDQLGADRLGCYGAEEVKTPRIDALAAGALTYTRAYTATPICTPYRGVLFSGRYPYETGVTENGQALPESGYIPLAQRFNEAGYATSYVGKWHLSGDPQGNRWVPPGKRGGFSDFVGWESHHVDHYKGLIFDNTPDPIQMPGHETDSLTDIALERLNRLKAGVKPFCLFVAYQAPHPPCTPPEEYTGLYADYRGKPRKNVPDNVAGYDRPGWKAQYPHAEFVKRYFGEISHLDGAVGRIMDALEDLGLAEETLVVCTSDHGEMAGSHGVYGKGIMKEESVHVPLIVRVPGRNPDRTDRLFSTVDFYPTLLSFFDIDAGGKCRGIDQSDFWRSEEGSQRSIVFSEYRTRAAITDRYKVVTDMDIGKVVEMYDMIDDPYELKNLADDRNRSGDRKRILSAMGEEFC